MPPAHLLNFSTNLASKPNTNIATAASALNTNPTTLNSHVNAEQILLQRIQLLQYFLKITGPAINSLNKRLPIRNEQKSISNIAAKPNLLNALMVYQNRAQSMDREVVVNSASLEDVPLSEVCSD